MVKFSMGWLWHRRLDHVGMRNLAKLQKGEHILGLTNVIFEKDKVCGACQARKQVGVPHPPKNIVSTTRPLEMLHMDLLEPVAYISIGGNKYGFVIVDDILVSLGYSFCKTRVKFKKLLRNLQEESKMSLR